VRARHGLSQREFAAVLGIDLDTLQILEQGCNKPNSAALKLIGAFDVAPEVIEAATLEVRRATVITERDCADGVASPDRGPPPLRV
jgi:DNA-binding XRE family transcriptional regulator